MYAKIKGFTLVMQEQWEIGLNHLYSQVRYPHNCKRARQYVSHRRRGAYVNHQEERTL